MAETRSSGRSSFLKPVVGGVVVVLAIIAAVYFRAQLWDVLKWIGRTFGDWLTEWVPDHAGATTAIVAFGVVAFAINWIAHVRGRLRAWVFALVVEVGLWLLFWYGLLIPSFNELFGLNLETVDGKLQITPNEVVLSGIIVIALAGLIFWWLEAREEWNKYRRRHNAEE
jgi:hypothetical protein